jgi:hypothetical protein
VSTGREIQKEGEVEVLKTAEAEESKSQESSICEGTFVTVSRAPKKFTLEFQFEIEIVET